jgi:DNA-binding transcriptional LysR family regulator
MAGMDTLQSMKTFVRVAQRCGFAAAARDLRLSPAAVTKHIAALEERLGVRLLDRTTHKVGMTEAGHVYLERCLESLQAIEDADASVSDLAKQARGVLRVTAPVDLCQTLVPDVLMAFMQAQPRITVDLRMSNRMVDLVEEGIDVAVRVAQALDGPYVARALAISRMAVLGSPAYFARHGRPRVPEDLAGHGSLVFVEARPLDEWTFERNGKRTRVKLAPVMSSNIAEPLRLAALGGAGLLIAPSFMIPRADVQAGLLEPVLRDWSLPQFKLYAVYPHRRFLSSKVRLFIDALRAAYGDGQSDPWWPVAAGAEVQAPVRRRAKA